MNCKASTVYLVVVQQGQRPPGLGEGHWALRRADGVVEAKRAAARTDTHSHIYKHNEPSGARQQQVSPSDSDISIL